MVVLLMVINPMGLNPYQKIIHKNKQDILLMEEILLTTRDGAKTL